jgi:thioester reductase-like protein
LFALDGDISNPKIFAEPFDGRIDTVINCAADVSHFAFDDKLDRVNTGGVRNLTQLCAEHCAALVQVSTISIGGVYESGEPPLTLTERELFIGQEIKNQYILSKFMAEYEALTAAVRHGIAVKLMRVGNLQGRISDGEFQLNRQKNAFTRQIASYVKIGTVPESTYRSSVNFSPVDDVARMIVALSTLPEAYRVFHVYPPSEVPYAQIFRCLEALGHPIEVVPDDVFEQRVKVLSETEEGREMLEGLFVERPDLRYRWTAVDDRATQALLDRLGLAWNEISDKYLTRCFRGLEEFGTFDL